MRYIHSNDELPTVFDLSQALQSFTDSIRHEPHLLPQDADELRQQFLSGLSVLAIDEECQLVGHVTLWRLTDDPLVYEMGTSWVLPETRGRGVGIALYRELLRAHATKNILATTTNEVAVKTGIRVGLQIVKRSDLPKVVQTACCICPAKKTGTSDNRFCQLAWGEKQRLSHLSPCLVRVTKQTAARLQLV